MCKILITGGAGFIGSNLCDAFILDGYEVVCFDNFSTGFKDNIKHLMFNEKFKLIEGDIRNIEECSFAVKNCDYVLHHAALGSVPRSICDPIATNSVNIDGFLNMLIAARDAGVKRFVYAASSSTYGDSETLPKVEDVIGKPLSPYAITKYVNELYADVFSKTYGMQLIGLRYFNVFGKRQNPNGPYAAVIPLFIKQLLCHKNPIINGNGEYSRDFTYIKNVINMNFLAIKTNNQNAINNVYNTAFGQSTTLNSLVSMIKKCISEFDEDVLQIEPIYREYRQGDIPHSLASISKAKELLNYVPVYSIEDGLKELIPWYIENINNKCYSK